MFSLKCNTCIIYDLAHKCYNVIRLYSPPLMSYLHHFYTRQNSDQVCRMKLGKPKVISVIIAIGYIYTS